MSPVPRLPVLSLLGFTVLFSAACSSAFSADDSADGSLSPDGTSSGGASAEGSADGTNGPGVDAPSGQDAQGGGDGTVGAQDAADAVATGAADATSASDASDARDAPPVIDAAAPPCDPSETPSATAIYVSAVNGDDTNGNGSAINPLKTVAHGLLAAASSTTKKTVYLDAGTYSEAVVFTSADSGVTVRGGFKDTGTVWLRDCTAAARTLIKSPLAIGVDVSGTSPSAGLRDLAVTTKATGASPADAPGETLYGIRVSGAGTLFSLSGVTVLAGDGGAGGTASPGTVPASPLGTCASACSDGTAGSTAGPAGAATAGSFAVGGYVPGDGLAGVDGPSGHNGSAGAAKSNTTCTVCTGCGALHCLCACAQSGCGNYCDTGTQSTATVTTAPGPCGCGGAGGVHGNAGRGGGASVGLFVSGTATVSTTFTVLEGGSGGAGSAGGASAAGATGSTGTAASASCAQGGCTCSVNGGGGANCGTSAPAVAVTSTAGGTGGHGGSSSAGSGGAGGASYGAVLVGGASVIDDNTVFSAGTGGAGAGGAPSGATGGKAAF